MESYRGWRVKRNDDWNDRLLGLMPSKPPVQLQSASAQTIWTSSTMVAECNHGCDIKVCLEQEHTCMCGLYSLRDPARLMEEYSYLEVYGVVYNHGIVIEGEKGFRAEKVTIRVLYTADFALAEQLKVAYPDVAIRFPPKEFIKKTPKKRDDNSRWQSAYAKKLAREAARAQSLTLSKIVYPGGFPAEQKRIASLLKGAKREEIVKFAKEYAQSDWSDRCWQGQREKRNKAKAGDIIFRANDDTVPYVFVGSSRPNEYQSMRFMIGAGGLLVRHPNIRRWDEEPGMMKARKQAIEEWE